MKFQNICGNITITGTVEEFSNMTAAQLHDYMMKNVETIVQCLPPPVYESLLEKDRADIPGIDYLGPEISKMLNS